MTFYHTLEGDARKAYEDAIAVIWAEAQRQLGLAEDDLVLRDLLAKEDLNIGASGTESWVGTFTSAAYTTFVNTTIDDTRFTAIYGFAIGLGARTSGAGFLSIIRITRGGKVLRMWQIEPHTNVSTSGDLYQFFADDPVTAFQNIPLKVEVYSNGAATAVLTLLGKVAEPEGKVINR